MQLGVSLGIPYTLGKPAAVFSPLDLSPVLWLDASDTSTITESGGSVSQWDDKSGNGNNVTQGTAARQPTTGTRTMNGLNVLDFNSDSIATAADALTSMSQFIVFVVASTDNAAVNQYLIDTTSGGRAILGISSSQYLLAQGTNQFGGTPDTSDHVFRAVFDTTDELYVDQVSTISGNAGTTAITSIRFGSNQLVSTVFWDGTIAEIIVVNGTLTAGEIAATESYLAAKWGITL